MNTKIAACGLNCSECPAFIATHSDDNELRITTAREWSSAYNATITAEMVNCAGCFSESGPLFGHCMECEIRQCARDASLSGCAVCTDYPCGKLTEFFTHAPDAQKNCDELRNKSYN
ncbi:MAG: DUF3795 domain-containing protein [Spirochaetes bacterium]|jgi:hypothetical protein|nr:DUF3795 domain-containing protein [Spirochaetota bacterium]